MKRRRTVIRNRAENFAKMGNTDNMMYVVGATKAEKLEEIRELVPDHFLWCRGLVRRAEAWKKWPNMA